MKLISGLAAVALAATTLVVAAPAQAAETPADRAVSAGSTWLKGQLTAGILHNDEYDYDDLGLSADIAFALDAVGGQDATVDQIAAAVGDDVTSWYDYGTIYTGSAAKAIALMQVGGLDATNVGGVDLQDVVEDNVATTSPIVGRVQNAGETVYPSGEPTDTLNVISQSWAARALGGQDSDLADEVMAFLLKQQCDDGSFRSALTKDKAAPENQQGCAAGTAGEVDTTALTVLNILATPDASVTAKGAALLAASWLKTQQAADGSFSAGALGVNSNTTGLAGWALAEAGQHAAATKAASWLRGVQVADIAPCATTLSADNGAIAYAPADLATVRGAGSFSVPQRELTRRASAQALPALANLPAGADVTVSAPASAVEKSTVTVTVAGLGAGEPACVSLGSEAKSVTGTGSTVPVTFTLPAGAATRTFRVTTLTGSSTATTAATATPATPTPTPVPAEPTVGDLDVAKVVKVGRKGIFKVEVACDSTVDCTGKLKVRTVGKVVRPNGAKKVLVVAKSAYDVEAGETAKVVLRLTKPARAAVGTTRTRVVAVQTADGADAVSTKFWLRRK
jgi:hypothetical protein